MRRLAVVLLVVLAAHPALGQGFLTPEGPVAAAQREHLIRVTMVTMIAVLPVLIGVPLILWRYRRGGRGAYRPGFDFSAPLEIAMWGVPAAIIVLLGTWLWQSTEALDPYEPLGTDPLQVQVIGLNWKWLFLYPDQGIASIGTLAIPAGRPVRLQLTTDTVMQSFMVPALAGQIYAMPGMVSDLNLMASRVGTLTGANTQFNGTGFAGQQVDVQVMTPDDWTAWVQGGTTAPSLDAARYARLGVAGTTAQALQARYAGLAVAGAYAGSPSPAEWPAIERRLAASDPDILFVAYGHPKQDLWIDARLAQMPAAVAIGVGGAFDFVAGVTPRAPRWMRRLGIEWLHRLVTQPWRWRRMLKLPQFVGMVFLNEPD